MKSNDIDHPEHTSFPRTCYVKGLSIRVATTQRFKNQDHSFLPFQELSIEAPLKIFNKKFSTNHDLLLASVSSLLSSGQNSVIGYTLPRQS